MRIQKHLIAALALLVGSVLMACGGGGDKPSLLSGGGPTPAAQATASGTAAAATAITHAKTDTTGAIPADWKKYTVEALEFYLPASYEGGKPGSKDLQNLSDALRKTGKTAMADAFDASAKQLTFLFIAIDQNSAGFGTNINIARTDVPASASLDQIYSASESQLSAAGLNVVEHGVVKLGTLDSMRIHAQYSLSGSRIDGYEYLIKQGTRLYTVTYTCLQSSTADLKVFDQSVKTIKLTS
jgi:hypothetical protein